MSFTPIDITTHGPSDLGDMENENHRKARHVNFEAKTATFTVAAGDATGTPVDWYTCDATSGAIVGNLPAVADADVGRIFYMTKTDAGANAVGFDGSGAETINGATTYNTTTQYQTVAKSNKHKSKSNIKRL